MLKERMLVQLGTKGPTSLQLSLVIATSLDCERRRVVIVKVFIM